jgi:hypothetical protein
MHDNNKKSGLPCVYICQSMSLLVLSGQDLCPCVTFRQADNVIQVYSFHFVLSLFKTSCL